MDPRSLALVLRGALSPVPEERNAAEKSLGEFQYTPQHVVRLLQIIADDTCDMALRHVGSIHLKNFVAKNWSPFKPGEPQDILESDKSIFRENILGVVVQVPQLLRAQVIECIRTIINVDYPEQWPGLLHWIKCNLHLQDRYVLGALYVLLILTKKYQFKLDEERIPLSVIVEDIFLHLLSVFNKFVQIVHLSTEVADLIKIICKIFWSSIYLEIPKQICDPNIFDSWMALFLTILGRPIPIEGQPSDPDNKKCWGWWKVKKWTILIFICLLIRFDDLKPQTPHMKIIAQMFYKKYAVKILECHLQSLNVLRAGGYLPDRIINLVLRYLQSCILKNSIYQLRQPQLGLFLFEIIFPLMCFNDNDGKLWKEDPHEYVKKRYDSRQDLYSPRSAAVNLLLVLLTKCEKCNLQKFMQFIGEIFRRYNGAPVESKPYSQKYGALHAIGVLSNTLKQTEPYNSQLENILVGHVIPEFMSPVGHLRAKAAWVAGLYADIEFSEQNNFRVAMNYVVSGLCDPELPVRVDSIFALSCFIDTCKDLNEIRQILPQLLDDIFKLMGEVENDDLVCTLEILVVKFGEEMAPYAIGLCENLAAAFWKCMNISEANGEVDDSSPSAAVGCLHAINVVLESVNKLSHLFVQIELILLPIMQRMLTPDGQDVFEEVLEIVTYMTFYSPTISIAMWSLWPLIMDALQDWAINFFENTLVLLDNYISRGTAHFLSCKDPDYQQSLWITLSSIVSDKNLKDVDIEPAPKLIEAVMQNCKGHVDHWIEPYLIITIDRLHRTEKPNLKCLLVQVVVNALYYDASLTLDILHKLGVATEFFDFWFKLLCQINENGLCANFKRARDKKVCCLGLTSLLGLPADKLPLDSLEIVFKITLDLLVSYSNQVAVADDEANEIDELDEEMEVYVEDGKGKENDENDESDDDYCDDEELKSPVDVVDPFVFFVETVQAIQASDPARIRNSMENLDRHYQTLAISVAQHAEEGRMRVGEGENVECVEEVILDQSLCPRYS